MMNEKKKKVPQLRFPGFSGEWEERKLGDVGKTQSGIGFPDAEQGGIEGIPFFKVSDMNNDGNENEMLTANNYVSDEQLQRKKWNRLEDIPALVFAKVGAAIMLNRKRIVRTPFLIDNNMMAYLFDHSWDVDFGKTLFETINLPRFAQIGALPSYNGSDIESIIIRMPTEEEQIKIGCFFTKIDTLITLHQRKLTHLQARKKGLLQKMFPKDGELFPELRFPGFRDAWEMRKLNDISEKVTEKNKNREFTETLTNSAEYGILSQNDYFEKEISNEKNIDGYYVVRSDDFVYNPRISNYAPVGPIKRNKLNRTGIMSPLYYVLRTKDIDLIFLEKYFDTVYWHKFMELNGDTGARADRFAIKDAVFKEMPIPYPKLEEQAKIGAFFKQLDNSITLHQRKLDHLQTRKKALLQQMFI